ncbi:hypothetical protein NPIL_416211 [Nephila pilipes]|uniref:Uncharacterized protein n=1 Tax=Nephila pilipes TaxID=299642 RepID=A0A8X6NXD5_NEPPI|nr:hypothetical protein NPIL_416211 [Nephila pilipes]
MSQYKEDWCKDSSNFSPYFLNALTCEILNEANVFIPSPYPIALPDSAFSRVFWANYNKNDLKLKEQNTLNKNDLCSRFDDIPYAGKK